ncbi:MAG TPA: copper resistance protein CopC [Enteractinococcus helveticum]|uniref:Copper resistance protein CopC n=1 Tax=Enteractinococcus helveticum TaxID=1837282 RepID=A0A921FNN0_9MICC|nr:copper resistance CopC family protein [Enteractinococcus helveticum]HJF15408.1 copper resistance protein CopC [Enteractinococcus helveticum]
MQKTLTTRLGVWFAALMITLGLVLAPQLAHAHDVLIESTPEVGSTVETTPAEVRLRFSGTPLTGEGLTNLIRVTDAQGNQWQDGDPTVEGYDLAVPLCEGLPQGEYTVAYRVIYSDGHTGEESFSFTNADPSAPTEGAPQNCGEAAAADSPNAGETQAPQTNEPQATSDAEGANQENSSASIPAWIWISAIAGIVVVAIVVVMLLRGSRVDEQSDAEDDA